MGENTKIEWCDFTFNPWIGCTKVSPGCDNCYAEALMDKRYHRVQWGPHGERKLTSPANWKEPYRWANKVRKAQQAWDDHPIQGRPLERPRRLRVFCASLADVFDNQVPPEWRADLFKLIRATPELDWLLLTKRPENMLTMLPRACGEATMYRPDIWPWPNIWLGFTAEDQEHFDARWALVSQIPAVVRFCSYEPALGPLRIWRPDGPPKGLDWLICGGESGHGYRAMYPAWETDIRMDCERAGIAYFFKQWAGKKAIEPNFPLVRQFPHVAAP